MKRMKCYFGIVMLCNTMFFLACNNHNQCVQLINELKVNMLTRVDCTAYEASCHFCAYQEFPYLLYLSQKCDYVSHSYTVVESLFDVYGIAPLGDIPVTPFSITMEHILFDNIWRTQDSIDSTQVNVVLKWANKNALGLDSFLKHNVDSMTVSLVINDLHRMINGGTRNTNMILAYILGLGIPQEKKIDAKLYWEKVRNPNLSIQAKREKLVNKQVCDSLMKRLDDCSYTNFSYSFREEHFTFLGTQVISKGDIRSYKRMKRWAPKEFKLEVLWYAMTMANRYHYEPAYWDVYLYLWETFNYNQDRELWDVSSFTPIIKDYALYHLRKSASFGDKKSIMILSKIDSQSLYN